MLILFQDLHGHKGKLRIVVHAFTENKSELCRKASVILLKGKG
jgi:hypothetical protein